VNVQPNVFPPPFYDYETWLAMERATAPVGSPDASVVQALSALAKAMLRRGRVEFGRLAEVLLGRGGAGRTSGPPVPSDVVLGWQSLLAFRNAVRGHPLVIARNAARAPDSRRPGVLNAEIATAGVPGSVLPRAAFTIQARVQKHR